MDRQKSFRDLKVWRESMALVEDVYRISRGFPADERFGLTTQFRRAAVSIPSNIGEGARRKHDPVFTNHLKVALGSQGEVDVQLEIAYRLGYCSSEARQQLQHRIDEIGRMLNGLITSIQPNEER